MIEKMSAKEKQLLRELQAKEKRVQRAETEFFKEADARKEELLSRWEHPDRLQQAADLIGTDADTLYGWITSEAQIEFFQRKHQPAAASDAPSDDSGDVWTS